MTAGLPVNARGGSRFLNFGEIFFGLKNGIRALSNPWRSKALG
jgi:hypothetical protein